MSKVNYFVFFSKKSQLPLKRKFQNVFYFWGSNDPLLRFFDQRPIWSNFNYSDGKIQALIISSLHTLIRNGKSSNVQLPSVKGKINLTSAVSSRNFLTCSLEIFRIRKKKKHDISYTSIFDYKQTRDREDFIFRRREFKFQNESWKRKKIKTIRQIRKYQDEASPRKNFFNKTK